MVLTEKLGADESGKLLELNKENFLQLVLTGKRSGEGVEAPCHRASPLMRSPWG
jgi:hypothetical protein